MEPNLNNIITIVLISWSFAFEFFVFLALQCSSESLRLLIFLEKLSSSEACVYSVVLQSPSWLSISISICLCFRLCLCFSLSLSFSLSLCVCFSLSVCLCFSISFSLTFDIFSQSKVVVRAIYIFNHLSPWVAF